MERKLKLGVLIDQSFTVPAWYATTLRNLAADGWTVFFIVTGTCPATARTKLPFFFRLYELFENWWLQSSYDAGEMQSIQDLVHENNIISVQTGSSRLQLTEDSLQELISRKTDLVYTIDFDGHETENLSKAATYGLWYISFGAREEPTYSRPAFREVMQRKPVTTSYLLMRRNGVDQVLYKGSTTTVPFSVKNNFNSIAWKSAFYLLHRLKELEEHPSGFITTRSIAVQKQGLQEKPGHLHATFLLLKNLVGYGRFKMKLGKAAGRFTLLYSFNPFDLNDIVKTKFKSLPLPPKLFYADPFVIEKGAINYIFFEEYHEVQNKAHISVIEVDSKGQFTDPRIVLEKAYHLSYPFVFMYEGHYYMVPETASEQKVSLYRARNFPDDWELVTHLVENRELIDATLLHDQGKWWLFASGRDHPFVSTNDQLFIFYSENLFSNRWKPHAQNPVVTQIQNCRPAGRIFRQGTSWYRPAQDNASTQYGHGLRINQIRVLTEKEYQEEEVVNVDPLLLGLKACHHLDFSSTLVVMDGIV